MTMLYDNLGVNDQGHLTVGGLDTVALAEEFGAPLYVLDESASKAYREVFWSVWKSKCRYK